MSICSSGSGCTPPTTASSSSPGAYKLCDIVGSPVLLVRGDDGEVRAFHNTCRHRGGPVVRGTCGTARMLVLPVPLVGVRPRGPAPARPRRARLRRPRPFRARPDPGALRAVGWLVVRQPRPGGDAVARVVAPAPGAPGRRRPLAPAPVRHEVRGAALQLEDPRRGFPRGVPRPHGASDDGRPHARHAGHRDLAVRSRAPEHDLAGQAGDAHRQPRGAGVDPPRSGAVHRDCSSPPTGSSPT